MHQAQQQQPTQGSGTKKQTHSPSAPSAQISTRYLTPPQLSQAHLLRRVTCYRPTRQQGPNLTVDTKRLKNKTRPVCLIHNYGHGGAGWTLGPGTAKYVVKQLRDKKITSVIPLSLSTPITVVGGGCSGHFTVCELLSLGYTNIRLIADRWSDLTSHNAGGLLAPVSLPIDDPKMQHLISSLCIDAYHFYHSIAQHRHPLFHSEAARMLSVYVNEGSDHGMDSYINVVMKPAQSVIVDFKNGTRHQMEVFDDSIFMNTRSLMQQMQQYISKMEKQGLVKRETRKLTSFDELIDTQFIINCSGLGSQILNTDGQIRPTQGHLIQLRDQPPVSELNYLISILPFEKTVTRSGFSNKPSMYYHPKVNDDHGNIGVIGGTFIEGATEQQPHEEEFESMLERARQFFGQTDKKQQTQITAKM